MYSIDSCTVLCMVIMRVSGQCTALMVLLARALNHVWYSVVLVQCMVLIISIIAYVQYTM